MKELICYPYEASLEEKVEYVSQQLKRNNLIWCLKNKVMNELFLSKYSISEIDKILPELMEQKRFNILLQNEIFKIHKQAERHRTVDKMKSILVDESIPILPNSLEKLDYIQSTRVSWARFIKDQIINISSQMNIPLCQVVADPKKDYISFSESKKKKKSNSRKEHSNSESVVEEELVDDLPKYTGVYSSAKMFDTCVHIQNLNNSRNIASWGLIKTEFKTRSKMEFREFFSKLHPQYRQVGIDDEANEWFRVECLNISLKVVDVGYLPAVYHCGKNGIPASVRPIAWKQMLNVNSSEQEKKYFESLHIDVSKRRLLVDDMIRNDVKRTSNDENYFVFEEVIDKVMIAFSRDSQVYEDCAVKSIALMSVMDMSETSIPYPPSGVVPFEGLSLLASPFVYMFSNVEDIYFAFRAFYCRHLCKLHTISSEPESLLHLCQTFENLLQEHDAQLFFHLLDMKIHPLEIAFNWIYHAFAGYLPVDQLLLLWDRILGYNSLTLLPVVSAAIFSFRSKFLTKVETREEVYDVFSDFSIIKVVPLLQIFLFN